MCSVHSAAFFASMGRAASSATREARARRHSRSAGLNDRFVAIPLVVLKPAAVCSVAGVSRFGIYLGHAFAPFAVVEALFGESWILSRLIINFVYQLCLLWEFL